MQNKRSQWVNQYTLVDSASAFHNKVRDIFVTDTFFKGLNCFQEVPVSALVPSYLNNYDAVDWYIDELNSVIELHGVQHYKMQSFGSQDSYFNQIKAFNNIKYRDNRKKYALIDSGFAYIEISYKEITNLNPEYLKHKLWNNHE